MTLLFQSPFYLPSSPKIRGSHSKSYFKNILLWVYLAHAMTEKKKRQVIPVQPTSTPNNMQDFWDESILCFGLSDARHNWGRKA